MRVDIEDTDLCGIRFKRAYDRVIVHPQRGPFSPDWWWAWLGRPARETPFAANRNACGRCRVRLWHIATRQRNRDPVVRDIEWWLLCPLCATQRRVVPVPDYEQLTLEQRVKMRVIIQSE